MQSEYRNDTFGRFDKTQTDRHRWTDISRQLYA